MRDGTLPGKYTLARMTGACGSGLGPPPGPPPARQVVAFHSAYRHRDVRMVTLIPARASPPAGLGVVIALHGAGARLSVLTRRRVPGGIMAGCHDGAFWGRHWPTALEFITAQFTAAQSTAARPFTAAQ